MRRVLTKVIAQLSACALFLLLSTFFWGWLFTFATDTDSAHKVTVYADVALMDETAFSIRLEEDMPDGMKMVRAHRFMYAMFSTKELENADIYIIPKSKIADYTDSLLSLEDGSKYYPGKDGIKVYDALTGEGFAREYVTYINEHGASEDYYLFFGANSIHIDDGAAYKVADVILSLK